MQNIKKIVERYNYKRCIVCSAIFVFLIVPSISYSLPVTVISHNYDLSFDYRSSDYESKIENYSYTGTGAGPEVSHSIILPEYLGDPNYPIVTAEVSPFDLYVGGAELEMDQNIASVLAEWDFIPNHDDLRIDFECDLIVGFGGSGGRSDIVYSLTDITNNVLLSSRSYFLSPNYSEIEDNDGDYTFRDHFVDSYAYSLSQENIYRLKMYAGIDSSDGVSTRIGATFSSSGAPSVPEPTTMLLFGTGLAGLVGIKFRRKKK